MPAQLLMRSTARRCRRARIASCPSTAPTRRWRVSTTAATAADAFVSCARRGGSRYRSSAPPKRSASVCFASACSMPGRDQQRRRHPRPTSNVSHVSHIIVECAIITVDSATGLAVADRVLTTRTTVIIYIYCIVLLLLYSRKLSPVRAGRCAQITSTRSSAAACCARLVERRMIGDFR